MAPDSRLVPEVEELIKQLDDLIADLDAGGSGDKTAQLGQLGSDGDVHTDRSSTRPRRRRWRPRRPPPATAPVADRRRRPPPPADNPPPPKASHARWWIWGGDRGGGRRGRCGDGVRALLAEHDDRFGPEHWAPSAVRKQRTMQPLFDSSTPRLAAGARDRRRLPQHDRGPGAGRGPARRQAGAGRPDARRGARLRLRRHGRSLAATRGSRARGRWSRERHRPRHDPDQPGATAGALRIDLRGLLGGLLVDEATLTIPAASISGGDIRRDALRGAAGRR